MKMLITVDGKAYNVDVQILDDSATPSAGSPPAAALAAASGATSGVTSGGGDVESPIAGNVLSVLVKPGDVVAVNDTLIVLEAMKMESNVASPYAGTVTAVHVNAGDAVIATDVLVTF